MSRKGGPLKQELTAIQEATVVALLALVAAQEEVIDALIGPDDVIPDEALRLRAALADMAAARKRAGFDETPTAAAKGPPEDDE